ncbi:MAG: DoxX family protein [Gammaproteobacteria bacterium]|nr:DoxX family protein [Gammaproteobacteria bacterium]
MQLGNTQAGLFLAGRTLMSVIFIVAGIGKLTGYAATQGYMESMGVPGALLPLVILLELGAGLALLLGWRVRAAALGLAVFSVVSALIFHFNLADQMQSILFLKNLAIAGGLLFVAGAGAGALAVGRDV